MASEPRSSSNTDGGYNLSDDASCGFSATGSVNNVTTLNLDSNGLRNNGASISPTLAERSEPNGRISRDAKFPMNDGTNLSRR